MGVIYLECDICNEIEVIKINEQDRVRFKCKNGHVWFEDYIDNGGSHQRPTSYTVELDDILFPSEKEIYNKLLHELDSNSDFYNTASSLDKLESLIKSCDISEKQLYLLMEKIVGFYIDKQSDI